MNLLGQSKITVSIQPTDVSSLPADVSSSFLVKTKFEVHVKLRKFLKSLQQDGYLSASIDSVFEDSLQQTAYLYLGDKYDWVSLNTDSVDEEILSRTGFRDKQFLDNPFNPRQINSFFNKALTYLENNGYPFAQIKLGHILMDNNHISASVILTKNKFYAVDSIQIIGEPIRLNKHYVENSIRLQSKMPYNEKLIQNIGRRISEDPFMKELKPFEVIFTENTCKIVLILGPQKANLFDGIIGFQPQENNSKMILTGDVKISLGNIVGQGERLNLQWQRLKNETQQINMSLSVPYLFKTPIGFSYHLDIYRRDSTFNNVNHSFTIPFKLNNGTEFLGYLKNFSTSLISTDAYQNSTEIPPYNDAKSLSYGVGFSSFKVENKFNPYKGWTIELSGGAGTNTIIKNTALENVNYDSIPLESSSLEGTLRAQYFQPVTAQTTLLFRINSAFKNSANLVDNQLYRIGGLSTMRGLDEQSVFASSYGVATIEYRLLFDENSRISLFYDQGWYEQSTLTKFSTDTPYAFGAGLTFGTKVGLFSLNYALGSQFGNPINFKTGKIHFGFVNFF